MTTPTVLVTGATGNIGSLLIPELLSRGVAVRALVRDPARSIDLPGVSNVVGDLGDPAALVAALSGVDAAFLNSPSAPDAADLQKGFADVAHSVGLGRLVLLSQLRASTSSPVRFLRWHAEVEDHVAALGLDAVVLRPNLYLQSLLGFAPTIAQGWFGAPIAAAPVSAIDTRDIAAAAAVALVDGQLRGTFTLTGPRPVTHAEIARAISEATGAAVAFRTIAPEAFKAALADAIPEWQLDGLLEDYAHYERGEAAEVTSTVEDLTGRPARDVRDFARDYAAAFAG